MCASGRTRRFKQHPLLMKCHNHAASGAPPPAQEIEERLGCRGREARSSHQSKAVVFSHLAVRPDLTQLTVTFPAPSRESPTGTERKSLTQERRWKGGERGGLAEPERMEETQRAEETPETDRPSHEMSYMYQPLFPAPVTFDRFGSPVSRTRVEWAIGRFC